VNFQVGVVRSAAERDFDLVFSAAYEELRRLAATIKRGSSNVTLSATGLVNQAWIKLRRSPDFVATSPLHFKRVAGRAMRQVLYDAAKQQQADKRGGDQLFVTFDESVAGPAQTATSADELLRLEEALKELEKIGPQQAQIVDCRFYGGMSVDETAEALGVPKTTIEREWRAAKAWLAHRVRAGA